MSLDLQQTKNDIQARLNALITYKEVSDAEKNAIKNAGNSLSEVGNQFSSQLNKITEQKKSYLRNVPTSTDRLLDFLLTAKGSGPETFKFIKKRILEAAVKMEPKVKEIISKQTISVLGCSQEQTYPQTSLYIPVKSIDINNNLFNSPETPIGKIFYEKENPSGSDEFEPFGGNVPFPVNKMLYERILQENVPFSSSYGKTYNGVSQQRLFDIEYTKTNEFGVTGDFFKVTILDRENSPNNPEGFKLNKVGQFLTDYYSTIRIVDKVDLTSQLVNLINGAVSIKANVGFGDLQTQNKFVLLLQRILGLCFDDRSEIDVSGISKIGELDGVDQSFFEFTEVDLRFIDQTISNLQMGIVEFEDCDNVKLPVNTDQIIDELINFRNISDLQTIEQSVSEIEKILDSISENPEWKLLIPNSVSVKLSIDKNIIKKIPIALVSSILSPKVLLPIFVLLQVIEKGAKNTVTSQIDNNPLNQGVNNLVSDSVDFVKKFTRFVIEVTSQVNEVFLETLFDILKKDIFILVTSIVQDILKSKGLKKTSKILKYMQIAYVVIQLFKDFKKCKSLMDEIMLLLNMINSTSIPGSQIPLPLLALSDLLPGYSVERATINVIENLQKIGLPTGPLPDGTPNQMVSFVKQLIQGSEDENDNRQIQGIIDPKLPIRVIGTIF